MIAKKFQFPFRIKEEDNCPMHKRIIVLVVMIAICLLLHSLIVSRLIDHPLQAYISIFKGAFSSMYQTSQTLLRLLPIMLISLGVSICLKAGVLNLGGNGCLLAGGIGASLVGLYMGKLPSFIAITLSIVLAMLFGAVWSGIAGYLKARLKISEIYVTVMLNYCMMYISSYMLDVVWRSADKEPWSHLIGDNSKWPVLFKGTSIHIGFLFLIIAFFVVLYLNRTSLGYEIRAIGQNSNASFFKLKQHDNNRTIMFVMIFAGALAGLAGAAQLCGTQYRFSLHLNDDFGFTGIVAARLGGMNPFGILLASTLLGILSSGSTSMQVMTGLPVSIVDVLQGMLFISAILADRIAMYKIIRVERSKVV